MERVRGFCLTFFILTRSQTKAEQFKIRTGISLNYDNYSELLILYKTTHTNKFKRNAEFISKYWQNVYYIEYLPNGDDEDSFHIYHRVYLIQSY